MVAAMAAAVVIVVSVNAAYATSLASLKLEPSSGKPGTAIGVTGTWFATEGGRFSWVSPVQVRWGGTDGPVLASVKPDAEGTVITGITVPTTVKAGLHVIVATQTVVSRDRVGVAYAAPGTPARTVFGVGPSSAGPTSKRAPPSPMQPRRELQALVVSIIAAGFGVFAVALGLCTRELRGTRLHSRSPAGVANVRSAATTPSSR